MMTLTRREIEVLLDSPKQRHFVVSAYADMTVQDGFSRHVETHLRNQARAAEVALGKAEARKSLEANIEVIRRAISAADSSSKGPGRLFQRRPGPPSRRTAWFSGRESADY